MWKIARSILKDSADTADIEDCISEVFYKLWKSSQLLDPEKGSLKNYLLQMTKNTAIDALRKLSRDNTIALDESVCELGLRDDVVTTVIQNEERETLHMILDTMCERDRELITRRFFDEQKPAQISAEMQMPLREVENRLYRIKHSIRSKMP
jgi:RNA polymerase sigma-70 factor (ECF subfamily)